MAEGSGPPRLDASDLSRAMAEGSVLVLDTRRPAAYRAERIPGARRMSRRDLAAHLQGLPPDVRLVFYCT